MENPKITIEFQSEEQRQKFFTLFHNSIKSADLQLINKVLERVGAETIYGCDSDGIKKLFFE